MKKTILSAIAALTFSAMASAQGETSISGTKLTDNWSITIQGGAKAPLNGDFAVLPNSRGVVGLSVNKQFTPVYGLSLESNWAVNTSSWAADQGIANKSATAFDDCTVMLLNRLNLINLFGGWKGTRDVFDIEVVVGGGWLRYIYNQGDGMDFNTVAAKFGLNLNYNFGEEKEFTLSLKPGVTYDLYHNNIHNAEFTKKQMAGELTLGLTYHLKSSNGKRYLTRVAVMDTEALAALNAKIDAANKAKAAAEAETEKIRGEYTRLLAALDECLNAPHELPGMTTVVETNKKTLESTVTFCVGSTAIDASQQPNVERIASYLKKHVEANVVIKGYASPDGPEDINIKLANARAQAVKDMLVNKYGVPASRIVAEGQGIGNMFEENDWNRVSICTIGE